MAFPWDSFSANTLRAMAADVYKSQNIPNPVPNKAETIALLEKIEKLGIEKALKSAPSSKKAAVEDESASVRTRGKRKHNDVEEEDEVPKAKRGRPPRAKDDTESEMPAKRSRSTRGKPVEEEEEPISTRSRGRPRKQADEAETISKRGRGRPRKVAEEETTTVSTRGRGRPRKKPVEEDEEDMEVDEPEEEEETVPKRRGRPRKQAAEEEMDVDDDDDYADEEEESPEEESDEAETEEEAPKRSRPSRSNATLSAPRSTRSTASAGLSTRRNAAASASARSRSRPSRASPTKSKPRRQPRAVGRPRVSGTRPRASTGRRGPAKPKPKSKLVFDAVEIKRFRPADKGNAAVNGDEGDEEDGEGDEEDGINEDESSLQASNKENEVSLLELATTRTEDDEVINRENDISLLEIATGRTEEGDDEVHKGVEMPEPEPEKAGPAPEEPEPPIGSPVPANEQPTDDQIEEARLHDSSIGAMAAPAENDTPEITIEPTADEASGSGSHVAENGHATDNGDGQGLLRPRIITSREGSVPLNPEYSIEVYSPASAVHDSDDENWVAKGVNGKGDGSRGTGGGLAELAPLNAGEPLVSVTPAGGLEFNFTVDNEDQGHMAGLDHLYDNL